MALKVAAQFVIVFFKVLGIGERKTASYHKFFIATICTSSNGEESQQQYHSEIHLRTDTLILFQDAMQRKENNHSACLMLFS